MIVNELVSNSLKHAFTGDRTGEVTVSFTGSGEKRILSVSDNGIGLPADVDIRTSGSLGLLIVRSLAAQIGGTLEVDVSAGTTVRVVF